jgi:hypothetical protein
MKVEDKPLTMPPAEKTEEVWQPENDFGTGILPVFQPPRPDERGRHETARFPRGSASSSAVPRRHPSHAFCVEPLDLASVSPSLRSVSNSVRQTHPSVSANLPRKRPSIARRAVHHCAPLHIGAQSLPPNPHEIDEIVEQPGHAGTGLGLDPLIGRGKICHSFVPSPTLGQTTNSRAAPGGCRWHYGLMSRSPATRLY